MHNQELISNSVDARCYKFSIKLHLGLFAASDLFMCVMVLCVFWDYPEEMAKALLWCNVLFAIAHLPVAVHHAVELRTLVKRCDTYLFSEACLQEYRSVGFMGRVCFCVSVTDEKGRRVKRETYAIYTMRPTLARFDQWHNQRVMVAYDPKSRKVIVCSRLS